MKYTEENPLLNELLTGQEVADFRAASLHEALSVLHRTQQRRKVLRGVALAALPVLVLSLVVLSHWMNPSRAKTVVVAPRVATSSPEQARASSVEFISDEELLALFPNQPLALVGPEGHQQLIFLNRAVSN